MSSQDTPRHDQMTYGSSKISSRSAIWMVGSEGGIKAAKEGSKGVSAEGRVTSLPQRDEFPSCRLSTGTYQLLASAAGKGDCAYRSARSIG